jgi:alkylation response protein AidB-like acyl-CoA dehydrogenase
LIHAAIALGIAEDALSDVGAYIGDLKLSQSGLPDEENEEQPFIIPEFAKFKAVVGTAGVLLHDAARGVDQALAWPSTGTVLIARLAVADARLVCSDVANRIADEFFLLADVCARLGKYGLERHRRNAHAHSLHDPLRWWERNPGGDALTGRGRRVHPRT